MSSVVTNACFGSLVVFYCRSAFAPFCPTCPFLSVHVPSCVYTCTLLTCVCVCVVQLQQTCACCPWRREAVDGTLCAGTLTVRFRHVGPSSTAAVKETATASFTRRSVRRSVSGRPKVHKHTQTHTQMLGYVTY